MAGKVLIVQGGWDGHTPVESSELFAKHLRAEGFTVDVSDTLDVYTDAARMAAYDLIVPMWTMGQITGEQSKGLRDAVAAGAGLAGFHGGMCDSFRGDTEYQWMTGGQWVSHPGGCISSYEVHITNHDHPITRGLKDFAMRETEQYYMHTDPSNNVLATTTFRFAQGDHRTGAGTVMPVVWTRTWGKGRVFYASVGHTFRDFDVPEALEVVLRGMRWAMREGNGE